MTKIKLCGLTRHCDIEWANTLCPDYVGFVFANKSRRYVSPEQARVLKSLLRPEIQAVGVFVNEPVASVAALLSEGVIDVAQLHGQEDDDYIRQLRAKTEKPLFQAFRVDNEEDILRATASLADQILLDSGAGGTGTSFDWSLLKSIERPYFLAGGLNETNISYAVRHLASYGVDVSSGIETDEQKDYDKMVSFVTAVRQSCGEE